MAAIDSFTYLGRTVSDWRQLGQAKLDLQIHAASRLMAYYDGDPVGMTLEGSQRDVFRRLLRESRANWCELIVNAVAERLAVIGFNYDDDPTDDTALSLIHISEPTRL